MSHHVFQISLKSVFLLENGEKMAPNGSTLLSIALVYPREGVKLVEWIKTLPLNPKGNEKNHPLKSNEEYLLKNEPFEDKLLFKESIQGDSIIVVNLGLASSPNKFDEILSKLIKAGAIAAVGTLTGGIGVAVTAAIAETAIELIFDSTKNKGKQRVIPLGKASFGINNATQEEEMIFHLVTTKEIKYTVDSKEENGQIIEIVRTIPEGYGIARVTLGIEKKVKDESASPATSSPSA